MMYPLRLWMILISSRGLSKPDFGSGSLLLGLEKKDAILQKQGIGQIEDSYTDQDNHQGDNNLTEIRAGILFLGINHRRIVVGNVAFRWQKIPKDTFHQKDPQPTSLYSGGAHFKQ
uniref:Movement protein n=1 Tax=Chickpea chlorotic dwarf virus TaxID=463360 RepID=A0A1L7B7J2_9GEMI|nr:movement protein [Chickpea chlorotic dwarf virus]APT69203.1 movement protein [Chickpea chlorotic dwarf virus]